MIHLFRVALAGRRIRLRRSIETHHAHGHVLRLCVLLAGMALTAGGLHAQVLSFRHLRSSDGLSDNEITAFAQDATGFMWIATEDGLNRYDGYQFRVFRQQAGVMDGIAHNDVRSLAAAAGGLWLGTSAGLQRYQPTLGVFRGMEPFKARGVSALAFLRGDALLIADQTGLYRLDQGAPAPTPLSLPTVAPYRVTYLGSDEDRIWVGTAGNGLFCLNEGGDIRAHYPDLSGIRTAARGAGGRQWFGGDGGVFMAGNPGEPILRTWSEPAQRGTRALLRDSEDNLWLGGEQGLFRLDAQDTWEPVAYRVDSGARAFSGVSCLFLDRAGCVWVGTRHNGLFIHDPRSTRFRFLPVDGAAPTVLHRDPQGRLVVAAGSTLLTYEPPFTQRPTVEHLPFRVTAAAGTADGDLWLGTEAGPVGRDAPGGPWHRPAPGPGDRPEDTAVNSMLRTADGLWLGTVSGLRYLARDTDRLTLPPGSVQDTPLNVLTLALDGDARLYLGTDDGLYAYAQDEARLHRLGPPPGTPGALSHPRVSHLRIDQQGRVWSAGPRGLNRYFPDRDSFRTWLEPDGLPGEQVIAIAGDGASLWLSTNRGLARMDTDTFMFQAFDQHDGPLPPEFMPRAAAAAGDLLVFGGNDGLVVLRPDAVTPSPTVPPVVFTQFRVQNEVVQPTTAGPLTHTVETTQTLELPYNHGLLSFQFAALDYAEPMHHRYAYTMEGLDRHWVHTDPAQRLANYTGLPPGSYTLRVKGSNRDGVWSRHEAHLRLKILPPVWRTTGAYVLYAVFGLSILLGLPLMHTRNVRRREEQLERLVAVRNRDLEARNSELRNMNRILRAVNETNDREKLMQVLLTKGALLVPRVEKSRFLYLDERIDRFRFGASTGYEPEQLDAVRLTEAQARRYFAPNSKGMGEGIYKLDKPYFHVPCLDALPFPAAMLSMTIKVDTVIAGFLIFENYQDPSAFDRSDIERMQHLREHAVAAISRARLMEELQETTHRLSETQEQLMEAAHLAGRTDTMTNLLHNIGNALNTLNVSVTLMHKEMESHQTVALFGKLVHLIQENRTRLPEFFAEDRRAERIPDALNELLRIMESGRLYLLSELNAISRTTLTIHNIVSAESRYAQGQFREEDTDIHELLDNLITMLRPAYQDDGIQLQWRHKDPLIVRLHKPKFIQVVVNLLQNAREALAELPAGAPRSVHIETREVTRGRLHLLIADNGPGIPPEHLTSIFQHGFTTKPTGNGFGLHYCANAMTEMNGDITVQENPRGGAVFVLSLPRPGSRDDWPAAEA